MFTKAILLAAAALSTLTSALPAPQTSYSTGGPVSLTLIDAVGHEWPIVIPADQSSVLTNVAESISHVHINNQGDVPCAFWGVDGAVILEFPGEVKDMDVGPPQTIVGGRCGPWGPPPSS